MAHDPNAHYDEHTKMWQAFVKWGIITTTGVLAVLILMTWFLL